MLYCQCHDYTLLAVFIRVEPNNSYYWVGVVQQLCKKCLQLQHACKLGHFGHKAIPTLTLNVVYHFSPNVEVFMWCCDSGLKESDHYLHAIKCMKKMGPGGWGSLSKRVTKHHPVGKTRLSGNKGWKIMVVNWQKYTK